MAPPNTASPGEVKSTAQIPSPTISVTASSLVKRADHALTTPYVFPPGCAFNYAMTSATAASDSFGHADETFLYCPIDGNDHWASCQPTGAVKGHQEGGGGIVVPESVYRGAVCPSGWVAFNVGMASRTPTSAVFPKGKDGYYTTLAPVTWSTAQCCKSGDTFGQNHWSLSLQYQPYVRHDSMCISTFLGGGSNFSSYVVRGYTSFEPYGYTNTYSDDIVGTTTDTGIYTPVQLTSLTLPFTRGRAFYAAMSMEWNETENQTLEPKWPTLTSDMLVPTWTPGTNVSNQFGYLDHRGRGRRDAPPPSMPNRVAIPVIATLATLLAISLGALLFMLWRGWKAKRQGKGSRKVVDDNRLGVPMNGEAGSTAHLNGQAGDEMELRESDVAR